MKNSQQARDFLGWLSTNIYTRVNKSIVASADGGGEGSQLFLYFEVVILPTIRLLSHQAKKLSLGNNLDLNRKCRVCEEIAEGLPNGQDDDICHWYLSSVR